MVLATRHRGWVIVATFVVALLLEIMPLPDWLVIFRPEFAAMVLIYWCLALPQRVGVGVGWSVGLVMDVLRGALLGQHALGYSVMAYLALKLHRRIRVFPLWQQALSVMVFIALHQLLVLWVLGMIGQSRGTFTYWLPTLTSAAIWPWVFAGMRSVRRRFHVT
jgi:rod shape-determining protein MreD